MIPFYFHKFIQTKFGKGLKEERGGGKERERESKNDH